MTPTWITLREWRSMMKQACERTKEEVGDLQEITGPDLLCMRVQKGLPPLSSWSCGAHGSHVLLNGPLAEADAQFEQFPTNAFCSPQSVVPGHLAFSTPRSQRISLVWEKLPWTCTSTGA